MGYGKLDRYSFEKFMSKFNIVRKPPKKSFTLPVPIISAVLKALTVVMLFIIDFVLFTGSGNLGIFSSNSIANEIIFVIAVFSIVTFAIYAFTYKMKLLQNILVSLAIGVFVFALYNQFAQFDHNGFLGGWLGSSSGSIFRRHSDTIVSVLVALLFFALYYRNNIIHTSYVAFMVFVIFCGVLFNEATKNKGKGEFLVSYHEIQLGEDAKQDETKAQKFVYIFLPNTPSYKYFNTIENNDAKQIKDTMLAFYAKNGFQVFANAYTDVRNPFLNIVSQLNSQQKTDPIEHIMLTKMLYQYWKFYNLKDEKIYLKDNSLFDTFRNSDFKINAYKSREFDLCYKDHKINVDRCIEKINKPINIYDENISFLEKSKIVFSEWLSSTNIFNNLGGLYKTISLFSDPNKTPLVGINYNNMYVVNSMRTLDVLYNDIKNDKGNQAYFVILDLPADMFIYDEFCKLKPQTEWISLTNLPWVKVDKSNEKLHAYMQQTKCLFGKLEEFMQRLKEEKLDKKTTIILQGISGYDSQKTDQQAGFIQRFVDNQLITMAYKDPSYRYFNIRNNICHTVDILNSIIYGSAMCSDMEDINIHVSVKSETIKKLKYNNIKNDYLTQIVQQFSNWYKIWKEYNSDIVLENMDSSNYLILPEEPLYDGDTSNVDGFNDAEFYIDEEPKDVNEEGTAEKDNIQEKIILEHEDEFPYEIKQDIIDEEVLPASEIDELGIGEEM